MERIKNISSSVASSKPELGDKLKSEVNRMKL